MMHKSWKLPAQFTSSVEFQKRPYVILVMCALPSQCHFWPFHRCGNSPPPKPQKVVRHERTTQGDAIHGRLVGAAQLTGQGQVLVPARLVLEAGDAGPE